MDPDRRLHGALLRVTIPGLPVPQGSAKWIRSSTTGKSIPARNPKLMDWRTRVASTVQCALDASAMEITAAPIWLTMSFYLPRPKAHYRTNGEVKPKAPKVPIGRPDLDKLIRAVGDALTHVVYRDDSQVWRINARKRYANAIHYVGLELAIDYIVPEIIGTYGGPTCCDDSLLPFSQ